MCGCFCSGLWIISGENRISVKGFFIKNMYKAIIRPLLFITSPEVSHAFTIRLLKIACAIPIVNTIIKKSFTLKDPLLEREIGGVKFLNPVGLAAGFDKNATFFHEMEYLGFGY